MKKRAQTIFLIVIAILIIIIIGVLLVVIKFPSEDSWIKDSRGVYIKHGNPSSIPDFVKEQQDAVNCAISLYDGNKNKNLSSECLGTCGDFAVDIVHVPRNSDDDLVENQCGNYRDGKVQNFIEIDKYGNIVRIV